MIHSPLKTMTIATTKRKRNNNFIIIFCIALYLITVIPATYVYIEHAIVEKNAHDNAKTETKKIRTSAESLLFISIALGYIIASLFMLLKPSSPTPYLAVIIGTVAIVILYYFRIYGIPIPFTEGLVITDLSSDWRDVITKISQQILVIPVTALLILMTSRHRYNQTS